MKPFGKQVPATEAQKGIEQYRSVMQDSPYYRESVSYTIAELKDYLAKAEDELKKMGISNAEEQCISLLPYISQVDKRISILFTPSIFKSASASHNGRFKHKFNTRIRNSDNGKDGGGDDSIDPDNSFGDGDTTLDPYNHGLGNP